MAYIDRDKLIERIVNTPSECCRLPQTIPFLNGSAARQNEIIDLIEAEPAADVRENVRKPIPGYEGLYEVDECGRIFSSKTGKQKKQRVSDKGYKVVSLYKDGGYKNVRVHRAVAMAFIENPNNLPVINHKDEDKTNNFVENLEWCTPAYNTAYGTARYRQAKKLRGKNRPDYVKLNMSIKMKQYQNSKEGNGRPVICIETGERFTSICDAAEKLGICESTIRQSCHRNTTKGRNGMTFRFSDESPNCGADMRGEKK